MFVGYFPKKKVIKPKRENKHVLQRDSAPERNGIFTPITVRTLNAANYEAGRNLRGMCSIPPEKGKTLLNALRWREK